MTRLAVVTGLAAEAACIERAATALAEADRPSVYCAAASVARARAGAERALAAGAGALMSFGIAGGLAPDLEPGAVVLAEAVVAPGGRRVATDPAWRERFLRRAGSALAVSVAPLAGSDRVVASAADKRALFRATGAVAVDMESHGVAAAAEAAGVPLVVLRVVADPAGRAIPWCALGAVDAEGGLRPLTVVRRLLVRPWEGVALVRLAADVRAAMQSLGRVATLDPALFAGL